MNDDEHRGIVRANPLVVYPLLAIGLFIQLVGPRPEGVFIGFGVEIAASLVAIAALVHYAWWKRQQARDEP